MYIENSQNGKPQLWKYLIGFVVVMIAWQLVGSIPLTAAVISKSGGLENMPSSIPGMADLLGSNIFLALLLTSFIVALFTLFGFVKWVHKQSIRSLTTSRAKIDWGRVFFAFVVTAILMSGLMFVGIEMEPEQYTWNFDQQSFMILAGISLLMLPLQTSFEEYFFRGYLFQGLGLATKSRFVPLLITSLLFGLMHIFNPEIQKIGYGVLVVYCGLGLLMGMMTLLDEGLELALGFHAANNIAISLLVTTEWSALQTNALYVSTAEPNLNQMMISLAGMFVVLLGIFGIRYRWKNWGAKLFGKVDPQPPTETN